MQHLRRARSGPLPVSGNLMPNEVFCSRSQNLQNRSAHIARWFRLAAALVVLSFFHSAQTKAQAPGGKDKPVPPSTLSQQSTAQPPDVQPAPPPQDGADSRPVTS